MFTALTPSFFPLPAPADPCATRRWILRSSNVRAFFNACARCGEERKRTAVSESAASYTEEFHSLLWAAQWRDGGGGDTAAQRKLRAEIKGSWANNA